MENYTQRHYEGIEKALEGVGLKVEEIMKQGNKTVITVFQADTGKKYLFPQKKQKKSSKNEVFDG